MAIIRMFTTCKKDEAINRLSEDNAELARKNAILSEENKILHTEADMYWTACKKQGEIIIDLRSENEVLKKQNENQKNTIFKLREELAEEEARANAYKSMGEYKMNAFLREEQKVRNLEAEVESLKKLNKSLSTEYVDFEDLYDKLNGLESERDKAIGEKVRLEVIRDDILKENQRLKDDRTYLHTELTRRAEEIEALKKVLKLYGDLGYQEKRKG